MKLKIGLTQNILYQFNIFCTGTKTNCTKVQIELQHIQTRLLNSYRACNIMRVFLFFLYWLFAFGRFPSIWKYAYFHYPDPL